MTWNWEPPKNVPTERIVTRRGRDLGPGSRIETWQGEGGTMIGPEWLPSGVDAAGKPLTERQWEEMCGEPPTDSVESKKSFSKFSKRAAVRAAAIAAEIVLPIWERWAQEHAPQRLSGPRREIAAANKYAAGQRYANPVVAADAYSYAAYSDWSEAVRNDANVARAAEWAARAVIGFSHLAVAYAADAIYSATESAARYVSHRDATSHSSAYAARADFYSRWWRLVCADTLFQKLMWERK